jgi:RNA polymerase sigma factor (sigma-70 family)
MTDRSENTSKSSGRFPTTRWSLFDAVRSPDPLQKQAGLRHLIENYWNPIYLFIRKHTDNIDEAEELTQEFLTRWLIKDLFSAADPSKGRFRNYLCKSARNFINNTNRYKNAQRRHPQAGFTEFTEQMADPLNPETVMLHNLVRNVTRQTLTDLEQEFGRTGKTLHFTIFQRRMVEPVLDGAEPISIKDLAAELGLPAKTTSNYLVSAKRAYKRLLLQRVRRYAINPEDAKQETADLLAFLNI